MCRGGGGDPLCSLTRDPCVDTELHVGCGGVALHVLGVCIYKFHFEPVQVEREVVREHHTCNILEIFLRTVEDSVELCVRGDCDQCVPFVNLDSDSSEIECSLCLTSEHKRVVARFHEGCWLVLYSSILWVDVYPVVRGSSSFTVIPVVCLREASDKK